MNSQQAKEILAAYRPGTEDANDPHFAEALELLRRDPDLARWLEQQTAFDSALRQKIAEITVPIGLKTRILAQHVPSTITMIAWWRKPAWLAGLATAIVLVAAGIGFWFRQQSGTGFGAYRKEMARFAATSYHRDVSGKSFEELRQAFIRLQWPSDYIVPPALEPVRVLGGCALTWHDEKVSMLCLQSRDYKKIWLFATRRSAFPNAPQTSAPRFASVSELMTAAWSQGDKTYLLAIDGTETDLKKYL